MPTYKMTLEVEVVCPEKAGQPELTITRAEVVKALLTTKEPGGGYSVCASVGSKLTANLKILKVTVAPCPACGHEGH